MKRLLPWIVATLTLCASATLVLGDELLPGQVDFGAFSPPKGDGQFVEVNVPADLIKLASHFVEKDEPDVAKVLDGLKLVHVNVIGLDDQNRADLEKRAKKIRTDLTGGGWKQIVTVQQKGQDVSIFLKTSGQGAIQGLVAVVLDGNEHAVFANIVGEIKPEQLAMIGDKFGIDPLKKLHLHAEKSDDKSKDKTDQ
jgi:hypothetical protein